MRSVFILCLGNEIVADDGFGFAVCRELEGDPSLDALDVEVEFAARAGYYLIDCLSGRRRALIVDTIRTETDEPGTLRFHEQGEFAPSRHLTSSHQMSLPTALKLARELALPMPERLDVLTVEALDLETLTEELTPQVAASVPHAVELIRKWINQEVDYASHEERKTTLEA